MSRENYRIGIIGGGVVGKTIASYYQELGNDVKVFDIAYQSDSISDVISKDVIFVCVPTPFQNNRVDISALNDAFTKISQGTCPTVIIKSTVPPGTTDDFQQLYPHMNIIFNPEFLTEANAKTDFAYPERQILGYTEKSRSKCDDIQKFLPQTPFTRAIPAKDAELVKYFGNTFLALKVVFANQIYDLCEKIGVNYDLVKECAGADLRIGPSHLDVWHMGSRGYSGKCFPKDMKGFIAFAKANGVDLSLLETAEQINKQLSEL